MDFIKEFAELGRHDVAIAGGKGASLGEMTQAGIPVPPGFVILSGAFEHFLAETDLHAEIDATLHTVDPHEMHTVENASEKIQALILAAKMPEDIATEIQKLFAELDAEYVAVRSSATAEDSASAAWAGQLDSFLNTTDDTLLQNVQRCWASLFTPRAIFYRFEKELHKQKISVAVVVQKMVQSEVSGIAFSVHPVTEDYNQLIIEAGFGLGEAIVSGSVTPDSYVVEKEPRRIIDKNITYQSRALWRAENGGPSNPSGQANEWRALSEAEGTKPALSDAQALELSEIIMRIERHYGFPCDIEWAFEAGSFFITQSRPITTLAPLTAKLAPEDDSSVKDVFAKTEWTKIWTTEYSMLSVWLFGREYIKDCKEKLGFGFDNVVFLLEGDLATIYRDNSKQEAFVKFLAEKSLSDTVFREDSLRKYYKANDELLSYTKLDVSDALQYEKIKEVIRSHSDFIVALLVLLWSPNGFEPLDATQELKDKVFKEYEQARKATEKTYFEFEAFLQKIFAHISEEESVDAKLLRTLSPDELLDYSQSGVLPVTAVLKARYEYCVVLSDNEDNSLVVGEDARSFIEKISAIDVEGIESINGSIANKGKITGIVRKVFLEKDMGNFRSGEILVTTMTRPEWLPVMKIAGAFVTDAGGVLSHAAIVSRELNKPCIINTKIATQVLKDGDLVEVDADNGIVRILERSGGESVTELIKKTDWHSDWSGPFSLFGLSLPTGTYFDGMEKYFGKGLSQVFIAFKNGVAFSRLPEDEYHELGVHLVEKAQDKEFVREWAARFKSFADTVIAEIPTTAEAYIKKLPELLPHYQAYGAHSAATKIAFDIGFDKLSPEIKELLEDARKYSETFYKNDADNIEKALQYLAKKTGYAYEEVYMLTYDELLSYLDGGSLPPKSILKDRWVASGVHFTKEKTTILSSEELAEVENYRVAQASHTELTGQIAYKGKVRGKCRIVLDYKNAHIEKGEILVTGMTDPNFVELMKKAVGIITDGGGMLSHAAIVARELKKPCVIGTKIATQIFHDGDLVEVDADRGVVRILK